MRLYLLRVERTQHTIPVEILELCFYRLRERNPAAAYCSTASAVGVQSARCEQIQRTSATINPLFPFRI